MKTLGLEHESRVMSTWKLLAGAAISAALCLTTSTAIAEDLSVQVEADAHVQDEREPISEGFAALVDHEAWLALQEGKLVRARRLFARLVELRPHDTAAWRELGRVTAALGQSGKAVRILRMVEQRQGDAPDPELHFIIGQALIGMGEREQGLEELDRAEAELAVARPSHQRTMWLARIHALRGDHREAERLYLAVLPDTATDPEYESVSLALAEAYMMANEWDLAEDRLRSFLLAQPGHERASEMLAWSLESRGKLEEELTVRSVLAARMSVAPGRHAAARARALERAHEYPTALSEYRRAHVAGVDVSDEIDRLEGYLAPEVGAGVGLFTDPMGERFRTTAGASASVTARLRLAAVGGYEVASESTIPGFEAPSSRLVTGGLLATLGLGRGTEIAAGPLAWQHEEGSAEVGGRALLRTAPHRGWSIIARGDVNAPWRESAATVREAGVVDQAELQLYSAPFTDRLVLMAGVRFRRLGLGMDDGLYQVSADQLFGAAGADFVISRGNGRTARGHMLDEEFLAPAQLSSGVVASYRHYEARSDDPFPMRLSLVPRSSLDEVSLTARHVLDARGILSLAGSSGLGYDNARDLWRWRAGGLVYVSPTRHSRLSLSLETASETTSGIVGRNTSALMGLHVDL